MKEGETERREAERDVKQRKREHEIKCIKSIYLNNVSLDKIK